MSCKPSPAAKPNTTKIMRLHLATRKGLFTLDRNITDWSITRVDFVGDNVSMVLHDPRNGTLYAALDHGHFGVKLHRSTDDGQNWQEIADNPNVQDVHRLAQCASSPDHLWIQHHNNGIFKSEDAAASWTEITEADPSTFGFVTAVHPNDPNTAWSVPGIKDEKRMPVDAQLVVTRTREWGKNLRRAAKQPTAGTFLRHRAPPRDGHRRQRRCAGHRIDHRQPVDQRQRRRQLGRHLKDPAPVYAIRFVKS